MGRGRSWGTLRSEKNTGDTARVDYRNTSEVQVGSERGLKQPDKSCGLHVRCVVCVTHHAQQVMTHRVSLPSLAAEEQRTLRTFSAG